MTTDAGGGERRRDHRTSRTAELFHLLVENVRDYAIFVLDPEGHVRTWNAGAQRIKGYSEDEIVGKHYRIFYPPEAVEAGIPDDQLDVVRAEGRYEAEGWRIRKDGSRFWARVVLTALFDDDGELAGFGKITGDMTSERNARVALARSERQLADAQEIAHLGSWEWDLSAGSVAWSDEMYRIHGLERDTELDPDTMIDRTHPEDADELRRVLGQARDTGEPWIEEHRIVRPDGDVRWVQARGEVVRDDAGDPVRLVGTALDTTDLKQAEENRRGLEQERVARQQAERAESRMRFLAEASATLAESLDYEQTLSNVAELAVPDFADWCAVDLLGPDDELGRVRVAHADPETAERARRFSDRYEPDAANLQGARSVMEHGRARLIGEVTEDVLRRAARDDEHFELLTELGLRSVIVAPISVRGRAVGALSFAHAESGRRYTEDDLLIATELASRTGLAIENAQLHTAEQEARAWAEAMRERTARLQAMTARLSSALREDAVARIIVEEGVAALGASNGTMAVLEPVPSTDANEADADEDARDDAGPHARLIHSLGIDREVMDRYRTFDMEDPIPLATAMRERALVMLDAPEERDRRYPELRELRERLGTTAVAAAPLIASGEMLGAIAFGFVDAHPFTAEDRAFLEALAHQSAQALERARLYEVEHTAREAAEAASLAKSQFVAMMSHELRTPLSAILGYQELLSEGIAGPVTDDQKEQLYRIRASATHLRDLIGQILSLSRIEAGKEELVIEEVDLARLVRDVTMLLATQAEEKGLELSTHVPADVVVKTDAGKIRQIVLNLVSNAIKFTDDGGVTVTLEADADELRIEVRDTGTGIEPADQNRVFEAFTQVDQTMTRRAGGTGLGLPVSRRLAALLGGRIEMESDPGVGSTFLVRLPRTIPMEQRT